jgi:nitrate/nitrite-specific signal transduction histidine kinase
MIRNVLSTIAIFATATVIVAAAMLPIVLTVQRHVVAPAQELTAAIEQCRGADFDAAKLECVKDVLAHAAGQVQVAGR